MSAGILFLEQTLTVPIYVVLILTIDIPAKYTCGSVINQISRTISISIK